MSALALVGEMTHHCGMYDSRGSIIAENHSSQIDLPFGIVIYIPDLYINHGI
jgi:hypothetical protein